MQQNTALLILTQKQKQLLMKVILMICLNQVDDAINIPKYNPAI